MKKSRARTFSTINKLKLTPAPKRAFNQEPSVLIIGEKYKKSFIIVNSLWKKYSLMISLRP